MRIRTALLATAATAAALLAAPVATSTPTAVAHAAGGVVNVCGISAPVVATRVKRDGLYIDWLPCGAVMGSVSYVTVDYHPFLVRVPRRVPVCLQAGQLYYPNNNNSDAALTWITPVVRCN